MLIVSGTWADRKMKLALLCMGLLITILLAVSAFSLHQIVSAKDDSAFYYSKRLTEIDDLRTVFQQTVAAFRGWLLLEDPDLKTEFQDARSSLHRRLTELRDQRATATEEERAILDQVLRTTEIVAPLVNDFLKYPEGSPQWKRAKEKYAHQILPRGAQIDGALRSYIWLVRGQLEQARAEFRKAVVEAFVILGISGFLSLLGFFGLLYLVFGIYRRFAIAQSVEKEARATSELAERRYRDLVKELDGGIVWEADAITFRPIYVSPGAKHCTGIPIPEWLKEGRFWEDHIPWVDQDKFFGFLRSRVEQAVRGTTAGSAAEDHCEHRFLDKEGRLMWLQTGAHVFRESANGPLLVRALSVDITAMKRTYEALRRSEQFNKGIVEGSHDCIFVLDQDDRTAFVNPPSRSLLEVSDFGPMLNLPWTDLWPAAERPKVKDGLERAKKGQSARFQAFRAQASGETRFWDVVVTPMVDESGKVDRTLIVARDVTERRLIEDKLLETTKQLSRSNRDLVDFACVASHDLQEPLRAVILYLGLLKRQYRSKFEGNMAEYVDFALDGASRMRQFIDGLLSYSRVSRAEENIQVTALDVLLDRVVKSLKLAIEESGAVITRDPLPTIAVDGIQIEQLFQNLIANALKFRGDHRPNLRIGCKDGGAEWIFSVEDNGIGFDVNEAGDIFEAFRRLHGPEKYSGCGLGLAVCKRIAERHRGKIWVDWASPGVGTRICFALPKLRPLPSAAPRLQANA